MNLEDLKIDESWTLFLDRDGVINEKLDNDYVKRVEEFRFLKDAEEAIASFGKVFGKIIVVTNQQGIGKGLMSHEDLEEVHQYMLKGIEEKDGRIDAIYYCPELAAKNAACRKPNTGMPIEAKQRFPAIEFKKSIMVGDSFSDIEMGKRLEMVTVFISEELNNESQADYTLSSIKELSEKI